MNIVISGGSKGIGKAIAAKFAAHNHNVFLTARTRSQLENTVRELGETYPDAAVSFLAADLSTRNGVQEFGAWITNTCVPDVVINNAGTFLPGSIYNEAEGTLEQMIETNLYSAYHLTRLLLPQMMERRSGHIINICSIAALSAYANGGSYSISKYAMDGFSKNLREELKPYNIKVTAVFPGAVYTDSWKGSGLPEARFIPVDDIASIVFNAATLSPSTCVEEIVVRPIHGDIP